MVTIFFFLSRKHVYTMPYHLSEVNLNEYILSEYNLNEYNLSKFQNYFQFQFNIIFYILYLFILG